MEKINIFNNKNISTYHVYIAAFIANLILVLAFSLNRHFQVTMLLGGLLFFLISFTLSKSFTKKVLFRFFILSVFPFAIIGFVIHSLKYFGSVSWNSIISIYPSIGLIILALTLSFILGFFIQLFFQKQEYKLAIIISATSFAFSSVAGAQGWAFQFAFTGIIYFVAGLLNKSNSIREKMIFLSIVVLPFVIVHGSLIFIDQLTHVYPFVAIPIISTLIGIVCQTIFWNKKTTIALIVGVCYVVFLISTYWGMKNYLQYIFGLYDHPYINELKFDFYNASCTSLNEQDIQGKTTVIYFHTKSCSVCYKKLPEFEELYEDFKSDTNIIVLAAFIPYGQDEDTSFIFNYHRSHAYSYPQYFAKGGSEIYEKRFNIDGYPHVTIISKNGTIIHNGLFNNDPSIFVGNARSMVLSDE